MNPTLPSFLGRTKTGFRIVTAVLDLSILFSLVMSCPACTIYNGIILDPCRICTMSKHTKNMCLKSEGSTRPLILIIPPKKLSIVFHSMNFPMS